MARNEMNGNGNGQVPGGSADGAAGDAPAPATPRLASTVLLVRDSVHGIELYVQERVSTMKFAANMTVFPGGGVDARDFPGDVDGDGHDSPRLNWSGHDPQWWANRFNVAPATARALVCAAVRETFEETGTLLATDATGETVADSGRFHAQRKAMESHELAFSDFMAAENLGLRSDLLRPWSNWVTPEKFPTRFDTFFFLAAQPEGQIADGVDRTGAIGTSAFETNLLSKDMYYFLVDMYESQGFAAGFEATGRYVENSILDSILRRMQIYRWVMLGSCVAVVVGVAGAQMNVIYEMKTAMTTYYGSR